MPTLNLIIPLRAAWIACLVLSLAIQPPASAGEAELEDLGHRFAREFELKRSSVHFQRLLDQQKAQRPGTPQLMYLGDNDHPVFFGADNMDAAMTISTQAVWPPPMGGGFVGLDGATTKANELGLWDEGGVLLTHSEFGGRVRQADHVSGTSEHATHVAGTLVAAGQFNPMATGMSYAARLNAYEWTNDSSEMAFAAARNLQISNHSYSTIVGWYEPSVHEDPIDGEPGPNATWWWYGDLNVHPIEDWRFGFYTSEAADWDALAEQAPTYLIVKSAGNDRVDFGPLPGSTHMHIDPVTQTWVADVDVHDPDGGGLDYDTLPPRSTAKNVLTVGAVVSNPTGYTGPGSVTMTSFSAWGPTDDGRIKPDLVADGTYVYSTSDTGIHDYVSKSGTSMAAPNVAGSVNLIREHCMQTRRGWIPRAATLKAILIQTTDEAGSAAGPDYRFGWGQMNTRSAVELVENDVWDAGRVVEARLEIGATDEYYVLHDGSAPLRITLAWTDPPGSPPAVGLDPAQSVLVHDLDVRAEHVDLATVHFPWILDPLNPAAAATQGDNVRDNVEQIELSPGGGESRLASIGFYRITVQAKGTLGQPQDYSLVAGNPLKTCLPGFGDVTPAAMRMSGLTVGLAWGDYDGDGDDDVYVAQGTWPGPAPNRLFRNDGGGVFTDVTSGPLGNTGASRGVAWADFDNDADLDLYVVDYFSGNNLYRNDGGGTFTDVTTSVTQGGPGNHLGAVWGDYDNDGLVDLYLCVQGANQLLRNDGGGNFTDVTTAVLGNSLLTDGAAWGDYDGDGDLDLYLSNVGANQLLRNDGAGNFTDVTSGPLGNTGTGHGVAWGDMDNDGDLDLYVANNYENNKLLRNDGGGTFTDVTTPSLATPQYAITTDWVDFDNDGDLDIFVGAQFGDSNRLFQNDGNGNFVDFTYPSLAMFSLDSGGLGWADVDGDGDLDVLSTHTNGNNALMESSLCSYNHWLHVKLVGTSSNAAGIGARVSVTASGRTQIREIGGGTGISQSSLAAEFGLGAATVADQLVVAWPSGTTQTVSGPIVADQVITVTESGTVTASEPAVPERGDAIVSLSSYPNPFNPSTSIQFELRREERVTVEIFDAAGRRVRSLLSAAALPAGLHELPWSGRDESGRPVASGVYLYRVWTADAQKAGKMTLMK